MTDDEQPDADTTAIFRARIRQTINAAREKNLMDDTTPTEPTEES
ncbi:hypothetical protein ABRQ22_17370 [Cellulosimicrobium sp. ES-005]|uniref:Uncharacterized protein n=1 Tax=Cellulosimicrobium sp. ES-005 TaxID=3163031 RepID=A0AAU8FXJ6_9MICO